MSSSWSSAGRTYISTLPTTDPRSTRSTACKWPFIVAKAVIKLELALRFARPPPRLRLTLETLYVLKFAYGSKDAKTLLCNACE